MRRIHLLLILLVCCHASALAQYTFYRPENKTYSENLRLAAEAGDTYAMNDLGSCLDRGDGIEQNHAEALKWFDKAAAAGNFVAQLNLARYYRHGIATDRDYAKALYWFGKAAEQNFEVAQNDLGDMYRKGEGIDVDYEKALFWFNKAAEQGYFDAQCNLGDMYCKGEGVSMDYEKAIFWFEKAAEQDHLVAQYYLGFIYYEEEPVKDDTKALYWFGKAADRGLSVAQYYLGEMYRKGEGTNVDYEKALFWHERAVNQNNFVPSMQAIAYYYHEQEDYAHAIQWYEKARDHGSLNAMHNLGDMYYNGIGVEQSYEKAFQLFSEGKDYPLCKYRMALMLRKGEGVKADPAQANTLLREAADAGNARAQYQLGIDYYAGNYSEQNFKQAVTYLMKALENPTEAMVRDVKGDIYNKLAACYRFGRGVAADEAKADEYNRLAAECGDPDAKKIQEWLNQRK